MLREKMCESRGLSAPDMESSLDQKVEGGEGAELELESTMERGTSPLLALLLCAARDAFQHCRERDTDLSASFSLPQALGPGLSTPATSQDWSATSLVTYDML